jgi:hypothetical protein
VLAALAAMLCTAALFAPEASAAVKALPEPPPMFEFRGSHGYHGFGFVGESRDRTQAGILLFVAGPGGSVIYSAPATLEESGAFSADLGRLGSLDLHFVPDGGTAEVHSRCSDDGFSYPSGSFEGSFQFRGEEGYTGAQLTTVKPSPVFLFDLICPGISFGEGIPGPGAELEAVRRTDGGRVSLDIRKKGPRGRAYLTASSEEQRGQIGIIRTVGVFGGPRSFAYARKGQEATISPPAPFSGTATLRRARGRGMRFLGDLEVDFPGRSSVHLAGRSFHAHLEHVRLHGPIAHSGSARASSSFEPAAAGSLTCPGTLGGLWTRSFKSSAPC